MAQQEEQVILPRAEFIEDVAKYMAGRAVEPVLQGLHEHKSKYKVLEQQLVQRKARLMTKLPEIQKALDIVLLLIEKGDGQVVIDYELAEAVFAKTKVSNVQTVNLWLGAEVMVQYSLEEAKELLTTNLANCKANIKTVDHDLEIVRDNVTTLDVSVSRIWNHDVEMRRLAKEAGTSSSS